jgi:histidinol-phosphate/aromatic aminotransferase/cobyric acid decarboxylase-like protein
MNSQNISRPLWESSDRRDARLFWLDKNEYIDDSSQLSQLLCHSQLTSHIISTYPQLYETYNHLDKIYGVKQENTIITAGADGAIRDTYSYLTAYESAISFSPTFAMIPIYPRNLGSLCISIDYLRSDTSIAPDFESLFRAISTLPKPLTVIATPDSPTGCFLSLEQLFSIVKAVRVSDGFVLFDLTYGLSLGLEYIQEVFELVSKSSNALACTSFSKYPGLAGLRAGFLHGPTHLVAKIRAMRPMYEIGSLASSVLNVALDNWDLILEETVTMAQNKFLFERFLDNYDCKIFKTFCNFSLFEHNPNVESRLKALCHFRSFMSSRDVMAGLLRVSTPPKAFLNILSESSP